MKNRLLSNTLIKTALFIGLFVLHLSYANAISTTGISAQTEDSMYLNNNINSAQIINQKIEEEKIQKVNALKDQNQSPIEKIFSSDINKMQAGSSDVNAVILKQIGYDFFQNVSTSGMGKYDGTYKLNIGEKVKVYLWGDSVDVLSLNGSSLISPVADAQVDSKGNLFVPGIGETKADGYSVADVEKSLQTMASRKFSNIKVRISVSDQSDFAVFVYGYVNKPGKVAVGHNSSIIEALAAAGGVNKSGSLRNITYTSSSGQKQKVDLYETIFRGKDSNIRLRPNDRIFVGNIGSVIAIKNGVKIPGIYELSPSENIWNILSYAGGLLPSTDKNVLNIRTYNSQTGERISKDINKDAFASTKLSNGDIVEFRELYGKAENFITLEGNVKQPAIFEYKEGMKLSDILKDKNDLQEETFIYQAVIKRIDGDGQQVKVIPVSLEDFFNGGNNPSLEPRDVITVYKSTNTNFIEVYGCIDRPKQIPYTENLTLKDVLADIQFIVSANSDANIKDVNNNEELPAEEPAADSENTKMAIAASTSSVLLPSSNVAVEITDKDRNTKTYYLYDIFIQTDQTKSIKINPYDKIMFRPLRENEIIKTVKVSGFVNKPGVYRFVEGKKLVDMIEQAGGLDDEADLRGIVFTRASLANKSRKMVEEKNMKDIKLIQGQMASNLRPTQDDTEARMQMMKDIEEDNQNISSQLFGRIALDIKNNDLSKIKKDQNIEIQDGDEIFIPKESNHVTVIGEVYNETSFLYKDGKKAGYYIKMGGGYTPNARRTKIYKIGVNGRAKRTHLLTSNSIEPGDTIVIPRKIRGNDWIDMVTKSLQTIVGMLSSVFILAKI